ncbi:Asp-tRNA(Asn)/Glu-tRNA(Gln) amidotransferase subunit GatA [Armatimonas sp.]|uniref:Asp-tRNA(Asn)/Glu-tRNA(Gln) amidotransferase subunit GatA n=1 Tax=Armatimonas sp. TaxID=1872638 RepID=UPI00286BD8ED|nr:Asp-tRNA(Asn)/Glu-tRNA(Gln) amidotransferase subunit GatA [Armatimonas sp.]
MELVHLTASAIAAKVKAKEVTARAVTEAFLARIATHDESVGAFLTVMTGQALAQADAVDAKIAAGEDPGPLAGVPVALKDNMCTVGVETTCASKILKGFVPPYDATVVKKLQAAGAITIGKTNLDEFAMGSSTENSALKLTHNPWNLSKVPGGSSGGSAAAVAADFAPLSLGSDTGGSIRQPASFCGVVGVKPTYGRVSRYGLVAFASSLDQIGPFAKNIEDAALVMNVLSGHDPHDSTSVPQAVPDYTKALTGDIKGLRIGVPTEYFAAGIVPEIRILVQSAIGVLRGLGAEVGECSLPHTEYTLPAYYIVAPAEASSNLARYDGVRYGHRTQKATSHIDLFEKTREEGFGDEVKRRILIGTYALSAGYYDAFYLKAQQVRTLIQKDFEDAFQNFDVLITPTAPTTAFGIGEKTDDPLAMKLSDICTLSANLAGIPALSQCCGFDTHGLPVGMQLLGPSFSEELLFKVAHAYEQQTDWHTRRPVL